MSVIKKEIWKNQPVEVQHSSNEKEWDIFIRRKETSDKTISLTGGELVALTEILKEINYEG